MMTTMINQQNIVSFSVSGITRKLISL